MTTFVQFKFRSFQTTDSAFAANKPGYHCYKALSILTTLDDSVLLSLSNTDIHAFGCPWPRHKHSVPSEELVTSNKKRYVWKAWAASWFVSLSPLSLLQTIASYLSSFSSLLALVSFPTSPSFSSSFFFISSDLLYPLDSFNHLLLLSYQVFVHILIFLLSTLKAVSSPTASHSTSHSTSLHFLSLFLVLLLYVCTPLSSSHSLSIPSPASPTLFSSWSSIYLSHSILGKVLVA